MLNDEIRRIMTTNPVVASPDQTLDELTDLMMYHKVQQLPVVKDRLLVGMVTTYDLWRNTRKDTSDQGKTVGDIMNTTVIKLTPIDKLGTAAELFMDRRFKTLPVVNLKNELKGVVTAFDVIKQVMKKEYPTAILYDEIING